MTPEDIQTLEELSTRWKEIAFKRDALFSAAFHGSTEYWERAQPALNLLKAEKEEIRDSVKEFLEQYFPYLDR